MRKKLTFFIKIVMLPYLVPDEIFPALSLGRVIMFTLRFSEFNKWKMNSNRSVEIIMSYIR
jgi:hypothetical protein